MSEPEETLENMVLDFSAKDPVCGMVVDPLAGARQGAIPGRYLLFLLAGMYAEIHGRLRRNILPAEADGRTGAAAPAAEPRRSSTKIPVCGMRVDPAQAASSAEYEHKLYHFCSRGCADKFQRDPQKYLSPAHRPAGMSGTVQIGGMAAPSGSARQQEKDPVCGMSVDPAQAAATVDPRQ